MTSATTLTWRNKVALAVSIWLWYARIRYRLRRGDLNTVVAGLASDDSSRQTPVEPRRLGKAVARCLPFSLSRATCLPKSLTLFRLLHEQGDEPELVIGLPAEPRNHVAHAWIELNGTDIGPPPGGRLHEPLARYRRGARVPTPTDRS